MAFVLPHEYSNFAINLLSARTGETRLILQLWVAVHHKKLTSVQKLHFMQMNQMSVISVIWIDGFSTNYSATRLFRRVKVAVAL